MKIRMKPLRAGEPDELSCLYGNKWPPIEVEAYGSVQEAAQYLKPVEVERLEVWEKACGLFEMDNQKCSSCPYSVKGGKALMYRNRAKARLTGARVRRPRK